MICSLRVYIPLCQNLFLPRMANEYFGQACLFTLLFVAVYGLQLDCLLLALVTFPPTRRQSSRLSEYHGENKSASKCQRISGTSVLDPTNSKLKALSPPSMLHRYAYS